MQQHLNPFEEMQLPSFAEVEAAQRRISSRIVRTPLVRLQTSELESAFPDLEVYLKLENLQRTGSFEDRGAANYLMCCKEKDDSPKGLVTASSGNFAQVGVQSVFFFVFFSDTGRFS